MPKTAPEQMVGHVCVCECVGHACRGHAANNAEVCPRCVRGVSGGGPAAVTRESRRGIAAPRAWLAPASAAAAEADRGVGRGASLACIAARAVSLPKHCSTHLFCIHRKSLP